jgi:hypothetical protein
MPIAICGGTNGESRKIDSRIERLPLVHRGRKRFKNRFAGSGRLSNSGRGNEAPRKPHSRRPFEEFNSPVNGSVEFEETRSLTLGVSLITIINPASDHSTLRRRNETPLPSGRLKLSFPGCPSDHEILANAVLVYLNLRAEPRGFAMKMIGIIEEGWDIIRPIPRRAFQSRGNTPNTQESRRSR